MRETIQSTLKMGWDKNVMNNIAMIRMSFVLDGLSQFQDFYVGSNPESCCTMCLLHGILFRIAVSRFHVTPVYVAIPCQAKLCSRIQDLSPKWQEGKQMGLQNQKVC